ncbi:MAG: hypothetical protein ACE15C_17820 [Phycisphaerae bacterium]
MIAMASWKIVLICAGGFVLLHFLLSMIPNLLLYLRPAARGDARAGLVVFVEGIRWLSVEWDSRPVLAGLRRAGFRGELVYRRWHSTWRAWLVLPAIMDRRLIEREAAKLADFIAAERRSNPARPLYAVACSAGSAVMLRALEMLPAGVAVTAGAILAGAFDPRRDLAPAMAHVAGNLVVTSSLGDWLLLGLGTLLSGTADGRHTPSAGMIGLRGRFAGRSDDARSAEARIVEIKWRPTMVALGHLGGHFTSPTVIARYVAPAMGLCG